MTVVNNKRSIMTLFSSNDDMYSHQTRIVLAEKGVTVDIIQVETKDLSEELLEVNSYNSVPTLVDRDLILYESRIIMEYLDERFPHPPLMPVYPVARGQSRLIMHRIEIDLYSLAKNILNDIDVDNSRAALKEHITTISHVFADAPFFMSEEFSLADCCLAALLWRLPILGIELDVRANKAIKSYMTRIFERESFRTSLTDIEREMRV